MKAILQKMISFRGLCGLVGAILLGVVVFLFAPAWPGIQALWALILLALLPLVVWALVIVILVRRANKRDAALVAGATQTDEKAGKATAAAAAASEEERAVAGRLADALAAMKAAGGGKGGYLYERPWYVLIGPPGAGKTTAIRNSGLNFPLAEGRVSGVGGTRNCDWWITEQAVLIDTAGRYTTQDSDASADKAGWERFLDLLRRERPKQPLNGVVVTIGADMLSRLDPGAREQHAQTVRRRVRELEQKLGQRLPVYALISKADLIVGFSEFFDDLDREGRAQVWGTTFEPEATPEGPLPKFAAEFAGLVQRLQDRLLERLQAERGAEQRARIAGFPAQFASLEAPLAGFLQAAFGGSKLDPAPFLRGVYFTSGTQEGTPIDRLTGALSRAFGLDPRRPAAAAGQKGRSYFLGRLLLDVVFNEARLAARDRGHERRSRLVQIGVATASVLVLVGGLVWGWYASRIESTRAEQVAGAVTAAEPLAKGQPLDSVSTATSDPARVLPYLDSVAALPPAAQGDGGRLALSQEDKLGVAGQVAYKHALERILLPRLLARLEGQMREGMQKPAYLYVATRVYLMLGRQGPMEASLIREWMAADWSQAYPGAVAQATRDRLMVHLDALLAQDFATYPVDGVLVDTARRIFSRMPMAERVYARLRNTATDVAPWKPADALGPSGQRLFVLTSGQPVTEAAVPGLFTVEGLYRSFLPRLPKGITEAASESWVLGPEAAAAASDSTQLEAAVLRLYAQDYIQEWQKLIDSLALAPFGSPAKAAEALNVLGAPNSPIKDLLQGIARQLSPGTPPPAGAAGAAGAAASAALGKAVAGAVAKVPGAKALGGASAPGAATNELAQTLGIAAPASSVGVVATAVESQFRALREASGKPLDTVIAVLNDLYVQVAKAASAAPGSVAAPPAPGLDPGQRLAAEAQRAPEPLARWLNAAGQSGSSVRTGGTRAGVAAAGAAQLAPFCKGVEARFPFRRDATAPDMPMDDFARLFGPGGAFDNFFNQTLKTLVDTSTKPWKPVAPDGGTPPVSAADVAQFQRAAAIRDAFFPAPLPGQPSSALKFDLVPLGADAGAKGGTLEVEGTKVPLAAGGRAATLQWPAKGAIVLAFDGEPPVANDGPWAALRFVARGKLAPTAVPDRLRLSLPQGARTAEFELRTSSIVHPFGLRELAEFRCPQLAP